MEAEATNHGPSTAERAGTAVNYDKTLGSFILPDTIRRFLYTESLADFEHQRTISLCSAKLWRYRYSVMMRLIKHLLRKSEREKTAKI